MNTIQIKDLGLMPYEPVWRQMQAFSAARGPNIQDTCWIVEHFPVYTIGSGGSPSHLLRDNGINLIKVDRGGEITYHGPGQVVLYPLLDLNRLNINVAGLVRLLEQAAINLLAENGVTGDRIAGAPGVYVDGAKIAALGLRVRRGMSYHGLSLNVDMDLSPFLDINPCGFSGLKVTQTRDVGITSSRTLLADRLFDHFVQELGYTRISV
ncbi:MAG TPA: lipoyl(octanoyl) transferase LipB [Burkholderiales bacterium]|nr:lipoyl(octanoyl) transferase LipB [Burkholderiales bacterium]